MISDAFAITFLFSGVALRLLLKLDASLSGMIVISPTLSAQYRSKVRNAVLLSLEMIQ
jgi:hypothetical protein